MHIQAMVRTIRTVGRLTQVEVSQKTGIAQSSISKIERGTVEDVMSRNYRALQTLHAEVVAAAAPAQPAAQA